MELKREISLGDRIKNLRLAFQKPYHFFTILSNGQIITVFENEKGERLSFTAPTMVKSIQNAEDWLNADTEKKERAERMGKKEEKAPNL